MIFTINWWLIFLKQHWFYFFFWNFPLCIQYTGDGATNAHHQDPNYSRPEARDNNPPSPPLPPPPSPLPSQHHSPVNGTPSPSFSSASPSINSSLRSESPARRNPIHQNQKINQSAHNIPSAPPLPPTSAPITSTHASSAAQSDTSVYHNLYQNTQGSMPGYGHMSRQQHSIPPPPPPAPPGPPPIGGHRHGPAMNYGTDEEDSE